MASSEWDVTCYRLSRVGHVSYLVCASGILLSSMTAACTHQIEKSAAVHQSTLTWQCLAPSRLHKS